jgi:hypothetical protein
LSEWHRLLFAVDFLIGGSTMLREMLKRDFGKEFQISGGFGNSVDDPILLDSRSGSEASWTEMEVARCIYGGLSCHWRLLSRTRVQDSNRPIERFTCEVKYAEGDEIVTEKRSFYFDLSVVEDVGSQDVTPVAGFNVGGGTGMGLPYQLEWLHFDSLVDNEADCPGLGVSVAYSAPSTKATIYIYNKGVDVVDGERHSEQLEDEFASATRDLLAVNPDARQVSEKFASNLLFRAFEFGSAYSIVTLSTVGNHFFKVRATLDPAHDKYTFDCLWDSVNRILSMATSPRI